MDLFKSEERYLYNVLFLSYHGEGYIRIGKTKYGTLTTSIQTEYLLILILMRMDYHNDFSIKIPGISLCK